MLAPPLRMPFPSKPVDGPTEAGGCSPFQRAWSPHPSLRLVEVGLHRHVGLLLRRCSQCRPQPLTPCNLHRGNFIALRIHLFPTATAADDAKQRWHDILHSCSSCTARGSACGMRSHAMAPCARACVSQRLLGFTAGALHTNTHSRV